MNATDLAAAKTKIADLEQQISAHDNRVWALRDWKPTTLREQDYTADDARWLASRDAELSAARDAELAEIKAALLLLRRQLWPLEAAVRLHQSAQAHNAHLARRAEQWANAR